MFVAGVFVPSVVAAVRLFIIGVQNARLFGTSPTDPNDPGTDPMLWTTAVLITVAIGLLAVLIAVEARHRKVLGPARFGAIRQAVGGISGRVLAETLRDLERDGILTRTAYDEMPPRVEYELTPLGQTLRDSLTALGQWAEQHIEDVLDSREAYDRRTVERLR